MPSAVDVRPDARRSTHPPRFRRGAAVVPVLAVAIAAGTARLIPAADNPPAAAVPAPAAAGDGMDVATRVKIDRHVKAAEAAVAAGDVATALHELRGANSLVKQARGANHPDTLPILDMAADILVGNGQFAEAVLPLQRAIALRESLLADGRRVSRAELATSLVLLARVKSSQGAFDEAASLLAGAITHFESALEPDSPAIQAARRALADVRTGLGDHAGAEAALAPVIERLAARADAPAADLLTATSALARSIWLRGRHGEARERLAAAIARHERARGPREQLPDALAQLGGMDLAAGDAAAAGIHWRRALELRRGDHGDDHAATIADRLRIVELDLLAGETNRATDALERASTDLAPLAAKGDPLATAGLRSAAGIWLALGDPTKATDLLRHALEADRAALGSEHADAAADEAALGRCLLDAGDPETAGRFLAHARAVLATARGPGHPETLASVATLGAAAAAAGDRAAAEECLATLLERKLPWIDDRTEEDLRRLADGLGALADAAGDSEVAAARRLAIVRLRQEQFGVAHPLVVAGMVAAAEARQAAGASDEAAALYERSLAVTESTLGPDHPDAAAILVPLARTYRGLGDADSARKTLERALAIWEQTVGKGHPATLATLKALSLTLLAAGDQAGALPLMERLLAAYDADPESDQGDVARLLKRLSAVHESQGDDARAVALLARAEDIDAKLGTSAAPGQPASDASRLERLLAADEDAEARLAKTRELALDIDAARERIARATAGRAAGEGLAAAALEAGSPADIVRGLPEAAPVVASAWERYRAGKPEEALATVREATARLESVRRQLDPARRSDLAALLATLADLRQQVVSWGEAAKLYEQAALLEEEARGTGDAVTLTRMLALADVRRARGERPLADSIAGLVAAAAPEARTKATPPQAERLGQALAGSIRVALAAGDRTAAARLVDPLLAGWGDDDAFVAAAIDGVVMQADAIAAPPVQAGDEPLAVLLSRVAAAATRLATTAPQLAGLGHHAAAIAAAIRGDREESRIRLEKAIDTDRRVFSRSHPRVGLHLLALEDLVARRADGDGAADLLAEVRGIGARAAQAGASAVGDIRRLAARHAGRGELAAAAALLKGALAAETKGRTGDPLVLAAISADSGLVSAARGTLDRAEDLLTEAVTLAQTGFGAGHPDTVAHAIRRERIRGGLTGPRSAATASDPAAASAGGHEGAVGGSLAALLRGTAPRKPAAGRPAPRAAAEPLPAEAETADAAAASNSAQADRARRAFDAALRLYGGDPKKKKRAGAGRQGLENIISYSTLIEDMAGDHGTEGRPAVAEAARPGTTAAEPAATADPPRSAAAGNGGAAPRPSPFVAASKSGLRQRTALAKRRAAPLAAAGAEPEGMTVTVEALMRGAWSAHLTGSGEDAAALCDEAVALAARHGDDAGPQLEETLDQAAAIAIAQGDYARARARLERLGSLRWKRIGRSDPGVTEVALRLAAVLAECGEYDKARVLWERSAAGIPEDGGTDPMVQAQAALVRGRIALGTGSAGDAIRAARRGGDLVALAWSRAGRPAAAAATPAPIGKLVRLRLAIAALLEEAGDVVGARDMIDRLWLSVQGGPALSPRVVEAILAAAARVRRLAGDAEAATAIAAQGVAIVQRAYKPCPATAEQLAELALSRRAAGDPGWRDPARAATRILVTAARRMTAADNDPVALESLHALAAAWLEAGHGDLAADASAAAQLAAASLPATHPTARRVARLAARVALETRDAPRADAVLAASAAGRTAPRPVMERDPAFLAAALPGAEGAAASAAVRDRRPDAPGVSGPVAKPTAATPGGPPPARRP